MSTDGKAPVEGTDADAKVTGSDTQGAQQNSDAVATLAKQLDAMTKQYDLLTRQVEAMSKREQSEKDKGIKKVNQRMDSLETDIRAVLRTAQQEGKNVNDLIGELDEAEERETRALMREMASAFREGRFPLSPSRGSEGDAVNFAADAVKTLELDASDIRVAEFLTRTFNSPLDAVREGALLLKNIVSKQPSEADKASEVGRKNMTADKQAELMAKYVAGSKDLRGQALINFKMQMRKEGLQIS